LEGFVIRIRILMYRDVSTLEEPAVPIDGVDELLERGDTWILKH
jgi:hypothetical protein